MILEEYPKEELLKEIARREEAEQRIKPLPVATMSNNLMGLASDFIEEVEEAKKDGYILKDWETYTWEKVAKAIYGPEFFTWYNSLED